MCQDKTVHEEIYEMCTLSKYREMTLSFIMIGVKCLLA